MQSNYLEPGERLDDLLVGGLYIIQGADAFRFSLDAVLLTHFTTIKARDKVVDLGTGTGIIPILLTTRAPDLEITGVEIQEEAALRAARSVQFNALEDRISIKQGDLRRIAALMPGYRADLVISNPPYLPLGQGQVSPNQQLAVSRHEVHCRFADVVEAAAYLTGTGGRFTFVQRPWRLTEIFSSLNKSPLEPKRLRFVHSREDAEPHLVLMECRRDARPGLTVLPPLFIYEGEDYAKAIQALYNREGR